MVVLDRLGVRDERNRRSSWKVVKVPRVNVAVCVDLDLACVECQWRTSRLKLGRVVENSRLRPGVIVRALERELTWGGRLRRAGWKSGGRRVFGEWFGPIRRGIFLDAIRGSQVGATAAHHPAGECNRAGWRTGLGTHSGFCCGRPAGCSRFAS